MTAIILSLLFMTFLGSIIGYSVGYLNGREFELRKQIERSERKLITFIEKATR